MPRCFTGCFPPGRLFSRRKVQGRLAQLKVILARRAAPRTSLASSCVRFTMRSYPTIDPTIAPPPPSRPSLSKTWPASPSHILYRLLSFQDMEDIYVPLHASSPRSCGRVNCEMFVSWGYKRLHVYVRHPPSPSLSAWCVRLVSGLLGVMSRPDFHRPMEIGTVVQASYHETQPSRIYRSDLAVFVRVHVRWSAFMLGFWSMFHVLLPMLRYGRKHIRRSTYCGGTFCFMS